MAELGEVRRNGFDAQRGQQGIVVHGIAGEGKSESASDRDSKSCWWSRGVSQGSALLLFADAVQAHGMDPLEDVAVFPMARCPAMRLDEALDLFEGRDDPLLARGPGFDLLRARRRRRAQ